MKWQLIALALVVMVVLSEGLPQQQQQQQRRKQGQRPPQRQRPPQQGQRPPQQGQRPPQQGQRPPQQGQRPPQQGQRQRPGQKPGQSGKRKIPLHLDPNLTLSKISQKNLDDFLGSKEAVNELVNCFESLRKCKARAGVSLVRDVRSLGRGGQCKSCSTDEQKHTRKLVGNAIAGLQQKHPQEWKRLLPEIGFLL